MRVIRAEVLGMCFGVRDALRVIDRVERATDVTIHGQLVHNEVVLDRLTAAGFTVSGEEDRGSIPDTPDVLITAHGISDRERERLAESGKRLLDTTCPLVTRVHRAALALQERGFHVLVIGKASHVEVRGIVEDLRSFDVIGSEADVRTYPHARLGIVCQTTAASRTVAAIRAAVEAANPHAAVEFVDTVCLPTKEHQRSLERLLEQVEAVVVVGGRNSNNTRELVALCRERGVPALHVQAAADVDPDWLAPFQTVGLTAGTSTLDDTIEEVHAALLKISNQHQLA